MAGYVLYFAGASVGNDLLVERLGLGGLLGDASPEWTDGTASNGTAPDGGRGMLAAWRHDPATAPALENVDRQWQELPAGEGRDAGAVWIGVETARPLTERDLRRKQFLTGNWVLLADGQEWYVPIAELLPRRGLRNRLGGFERVVLEQYAGFYEQSAVYYAQLVQGLDAMAEAGRRGEAADIDITFADGYEFCWQALSLNYRVTPDILSVLGVLDDTCLARIIFTVICQQDITGLALKKKDSLRAPIPVS